MVIFDRRKQQKSDAFRFLSENFNVETRRNVFSEAIKSHQDFVLLCTALYLTHTLYCFFLTTPQFFPSRRITHKNMFQLLISNGGEENIKFPESIFLTALSVFFTLEINIQKMLAFSYDKGITLSQWFLTFFRFRYFKLIVKKYFILIKNLITGKRNCFFFGSKQYNHLTLQYLNTSWGFRKVHSNCAENLSR